MTENALYMLAHDAGCAAAEECYIEPMVVQQHENMMDDSSPVVKSYVVSDGPCGFAWVNIKPAYSKFAKWMVAYEMARKDSYNGGVTYWISKYGQSIQKKEAYARAFAKVLSDNGINAYASSRMD
ncbi:hypothetical protein M0R04_04850 [Candidatus Dojkabacteria bacterium]|jgi:hypothetical protein|nr:hypothetical protein [Candidatus Dojkabacteria bacterium]